MLVILAAYLILFSPMESNSKKAIENVLSVVKDIKENMINVDDVIKALTPIIEDKCACCDIPKFSGIFIPGGWSDESGSTDYSLTTSLYIPSKKQFCELPNVPNDRFGHTTIGFTTCGGWGSSDHQKVNNDCYTFNKNSGEWKLAQNWTEGRHRGHVAWETNEGLALVGGWGDVRTTIFHPNGTQTRIFYQSDYQKWSPCGIPDYETETIFITGGYFKNSSIEFRSKLVNRYDKFGNREILPEMNFGRWFHGCSSYKNDDGKTVLLVVGGNDDDTEKNTETLVIGDAQWKIHEDIGLSSYLTPMAVTLDNKIYVFARYMHKIVVWNPEIQKYETETEMQYWRSGSNGQAASVVHVDGDFVKNWCN